MDDARSSATSPTLLGRLRQDPADTAAWSTFVLRYGPRVHAWCRHWRLQEADARDVTQNVLVKLVARMRTFSYDRSGSFRGWLKTVTYHAWRDYLHGQQRAGQGSGDSAALAALHSLEAGDDLARHLQEEFDLELLEEAAGRTRPRQGVGQRRGERVVPVEQGVCRAPGADATPAGEQRGRLAPFMLGLHVRVVRGGQDGLGSETSRHRDSPLAPTRSAEGRRQRSGRSAFGCPGVRIHGRRARPPEGRPQQAAGEHVSRRQAVLEEFQPWTVQLRAV